MPTTKNVKEIYQDVADRGSEELSRASAGLAFSGLAAGLSISFGVLAAMSVAAVTDGVGLAYMAVYPVGFLVVVLGKAQLFTETTVTPVIAALRDRKLIPQVLRMWVVVLVFNLIGAAIFAVAVTQARLLHPDAMAILLEKAVEKMDYGAGSLFVRGIFGGWVVAVMSWLISASKDTIGQAFCIWVTAILIPAGDLAHSVLGSSEMLIGVVLGKILWLDYFGVFLIPVVLGNALGGVILVSLLNYAQVAASENKPRKPSRKKPSPAASTNLTEQTNHYNH